MMPPEQRTHIPPEGGWKEQTYYVVDTAWRSTNPIHRRILYVGFLNGAPGHPLTGGYTALLSSDFEQLADFGRPDRLYYLKAVCEIPEMREEP
jgi:hypothetical protein